MVWGTFGTVAVVSYIGGGYLADRVSPFRIVAVSLVGSGVFHYVMSYAAVGGGLYYPVVLGLSAGMGFCAVFLFFPASSKILTLLLGEGTGKILGVYYGVGGLLTAALDIALTYVYSLYEDSGMLFVIITRIYAFSGIAAGLLFWILHLNRAGHHKDSDPVRLQKIPIVLGKKITYLIGGIITCDYLICGIMSYFTPYLVRAFGISDATAMYISALRLGVFCLVSGIIWGHFADRAKSPYQIIGWSFFSLIVIFMFILMISLFGSHSFIVAVVILTCVVALISLGVKSISLTMIKHEHIPADIAGTMIGVVSFIGYSPDAWFYPLAGAVINAGGIEMYSVIFGIGILAAVIGFVLCIIRTSKG